MKKISNSEFVVMDILWNSDQSLNRHQIADLVHENPNNEPWELATISTFISRLSNKGLINYEKRDKMYCYYPLVTKTEYIQLMIDKKVQEIFHVTFDELLLRYTNHEVTSENKEKIHKYIDDFVQE